MGQKQFTKISPLFFLILLLLSTAPLRAAAPQGDVDALFLAAAGGDIPKIRVLQKTLGNLDQYKDSDGDTVLQVACRQKEYDVVLYLIDKGYIASLDSPDHEKLTPLTRAVTNSDAQMIQILLAPNPLHQGSKGALIDKVDGAKWAPIALAVKLKNAALVELLGGRGANANIFDPDGFTPSTRAASDKDLEVVQALTGHSNAKLNLRDKFNKLPVDYATAAHDQTLIDLLNPANPEQGVMMATSPGGAFAHVYNEPDEAYYTLQIPFATNRKESGRPDADSFYSAGVSNSLEYGVATVTVPKSHVKGQLESPGLFQLHEDPKEDVVLKSIDTQTNKVFFRNLSDELEKRQADPNSGTKKDVFLFIHGFNTQFAYAARKTAQLVIDLEYQGLPMFYSWPADSYTLAMPWDFKKDVSAVEKSMKPFYAFIKDLRQQVKREKKECLHLVAHSLGNRALIQILNHIADVESKNGNRQRPDYVKPFCEVIMASPATDAEKFVKENAVKLGQVSERVTIYASSNDKALAVEWLAENSNFSFPLGSKSEGGELALSSANEMIDLSKLSVGIFDFNHSKYSDLPEVEDDIRHLLVDNWNAAQRLANGSKLLQKFMNSIFTSPIESVPYWEMTQK